MNEPGSNYPRPVSVKPLPRTSPWFTAFMIAFIVVIVAAILYPVFADVHIGHRRGTISNLKQLSLGLVMYAGDYDERFPLVDTWMDATDQYTRGEPVLIDPALFEANKPRVPGIYGFAFYKPLCALDAYYIENQDEVPLVFQSTLLHRNATGGLDTLPNPPRVQPRSEVQKNYVAFLDTHVEAFDAEWPNAPVLVKMR